jgi:peptide/nickel transport system permease protein
MSATDIALMEKRLGLDQPIYMRYFAWLTEFIQGNFGYSVASRKPVIELIVERAGATIVLATSALLISYAIGIPLGVLSAVYRYTALDYITTFIAFLGVSAPSFFIGLAAIYLFSLQWDIFATGGTHTIGSDYSLLDRFNHLVLPATILGWSYMSRVMRFVRSSMLDVIHQDYIRAAKAKGLRAWTVIYRHALRNALTPVITLFGLQFPALLGGAVIIEQVFNWPGLGRLTIEAINQRDYPVIMGINLLAAVLVIAGNLLADVLYGVADPRIRYSD